MVVDVGSGLAFEKNKFAAGRCVCPYTEVDCLACSVESDTLVCFFRLFEQRVIVITARLRKECGPGSQHNASVLKRW